jgi:hypothetical protein
MVNTKVKYLLKHNSSQMEKYNPDCCFIIFHDMHFCNIRFQTTFLYTGINVDIRLPCCLCASLPFQLINQLTEFQEIWHELHATGGHLNFLLFNLLQMVTTKWTT